MTLAANPRRRNSVSMVGPSISGMMTSETMRSIGSAASSATRSASTPVSASKHRIAARGERARGESAHRLLVLDQEDRAAAGEIRRGLGGLLLDRLVGLVAKAPRKENAERRARARLAVAEHVPAGLLDDAVDHRQAEARAFADVLGGEERLEYLGPHLGRNAVTGVLHLDQHVVGRNNRHVPSVRRIRKQESCACAA